MTTDDDEAWLCDDEDELYEPNAADEIEQVLQDCGRNAEETWCALSGTEYCQFRCLFRKR